MEGGRKSTLPSIPAAQLVGHDGPILDVVFTSRFHTTLLHACNQFPLKNSVENRRGNSVMITLFALGLKLSVPLGTCSS